ncbi:MAG: hypothetical protein J6N15_01160 [Ruminiclostridium sp.]|nr:hypothetical protein [Ruminiclostridium sp.]
MNENQIIEFTNEQFGKIRTTLIDGEPWFVAKDAALALGYSKPLNAIERHIDEDDSLKRGLIDSVGRTQEARQLFQERCNDRKERDLQRCPQREDRWCKNERCCSLRSRRELR